MCADLMSTNTPLFIPCPNRTNDVGLNREKWVIKPSSRTALHLAMFEFLGVMMGVALRTGFTLNLDLPNTIWKKLLGNDVNQADLEGIDKLCIQALGNLKKLDKEKFDVVIEQTHTTQLSDGKEVELKPNGKELPVKFEDVDEFMRLSVEARLSESDQQIQALRKGLNAIVPANHLALFSWYDLELMVCGNPNIDIEALRKHTLFRGVSAGSPLVKNLWKCLESFNSEERQMFLRFVWGRSRLPIVDSDWNQEFTIHLLRAGDDKLPIAHTCFFSLEIPNYSSYDILRKKIVFAIYNCQAIDIDFNPQNSALNAYVED